MTDPALFTHIVFEPYGGTPIGWYATNNASGRIEPLFSSDFRALSAVLSGFDIQEIVRDYYTQFTFPHEPVEFLLLSPVRFIGGIGDQPRWKVIEHTDHGDGLEISADGHAYFDYQHADTWHEEDES